MATHSSTLAWKIPWMEKPGRLQSMWLQRVGHNWATSFSLFFFFMNLLLEAQVPIWSHDHFSSLFTWLHVDLSHSLDCTGVWQFSVKVVLYVEVFFISLWERLISMSSYFIIVISSPKCNVYTKMHRSYVKFDIICQLYLPLWPTPKTGCRTYELLPKFPGTPFSLICIVMAR